MDTTFGRLQEGEVKSTIRGLAAGSLLHRFLS
jgi:hypothetical protein